MGSSAWRSVLRTPLLPCIIPIGPLHCISRTRGLRPPSRSCLPDTLLVKDGELNRSLIIKWLPWTRKTMWSLGLYLEVPRSEILVNSLISLLSFRRSTCSQKYRNLSLSFLPPMFPLNPELLYTWLFKSHLFQCYRSWSFSKPFRAFKIIWSLQCPCKVGSTGIAKPIWIMSKKGPRRWSVLLHVPFVSWLLVQCFFFFVFRDPKWLGEPCFKPSCVLALAGEGREGRVCGDGLWGRCRRRKVQKGKMLTWLAYR